MEREKIRPLYIGVDLTPHYDVEVATKPHLVGYVTLLFQKFDGRKGNSRELVVRILDSISGHAYDANLCMRKFSLSLTD